VRWGDGSIGQALRWYGDEVLVSEGDLLGKTREQLRACTFGGTATDFGHRGPSTARFSGAWPIPPLAVEVPKPRRRRKPVPAPKPVAEAPRTNVPAKKAR
jgi:hypothetical protein